MLCFVYRSFAFKDNMLTHALQNAFADPFVQELLADILLGIADRHEILALLEKEFGITL